MHNLGKIGGPTTGHHTDFNTSAYTIFTVAANGSLVGLIAQFM